VLRIDAAIAIGHVGDWQRCVRELSLRWKSFV